VIAIELYIGDERLDTFSDESVTLTDSIQNVKDIEKIFTSFSRSFNVPASSTNNRIFKHYYNSEITSGGFDARVKQPARIELNSMPYKTGYIQLTGVAMKLNRPSSYKITFFGDMVKLKDAIGESKLSDLLGLGTVTYSANQVMAMLTRSADSFDTLVPLITHSQRLYYDSNNIAQSDEKQANLVPSSILNGVYWNQLKPAIRVNTLIRAIENTFPILEFTDDFFKNENNPIFDKLFLWVSRKSGAVENLSNDAIESVIDDWPNGTSFPNNVFTSIYGAIELNYPYSWANVSTWRYTLTYASGGPYVVTIRNLFGQTVYTSASTNSNLIINKSDLNIPNTSPFVVLVLYVTTAVPVTFSQIRFDGTYNDPGVVFEQYNISANNVVTSTEFQFSYSRQLPDITIVDFLSGLFKMFNLTAFVQDDGKIKVQKLDSFYFDSPTTYDITEYVDIDSHSVDSALPYRQVKFGFKDTKSFLANKYGEINNKAWGLLEYNDNSNDLSGSLYKIEAPFGHFLYERLTDAGTGNQLNLQWGYSVDKSQNAMLPAPLLFYPVDPPEDAEQIQIINDFNADGTPKTKTTRRPAALPMNHYQTTPQTSQFFQLNFAEELSEWNPTASPPWSNTLFSNYQRYITGVFNPQARLTNITCKLPIAIILGLKMNDSIVVAGKNYKINKITTNLQTGKSELELLNDYYTIAE